VRNNSEVLVTKVLYHLGLWFVLLTPAQVDKRKCSADFIELIFQDQYLGRNDMWRLGYFLVGQCAYAEQDVLFMNATAAKIRSIYIGGKQVRTLKYSIAMSQDWFTRCLQDTSHHRQRQYIDHCPQK
jgi:hypothetical protein